MRILPALLALLLSAAAALPAVAQGTAAGNAPPATAAAPTRLDEILQRGVLRVGLTGDYKPFSFRDADGDTTGLDVDMAGALAAALGVRLEIVPTTWPTLMADLRDGRYDVGMGGITVTLDRQKAAFFSTPVMGSGKVAIARCADQAKYGTLAAIDQPGVRVMANPGGTNERFDRANLHAAQIVVFPDNSRIFDEVAAGHADVMITDAVEARLQQKQHPGLCAIHPDQTFDVSELGYLLPRDIALKLFVDQWLHQMQVSGARQRAVAKWID